MSTEPEKKQGKNKLPKGFVPLQKGQTANPNGRPKGKLNRRTILKRWLEVNTKVKNPFTGKDELLSQADQIVLAQIAKALDGDTRAYQELMDGYFGKMVDKQEHTLPLRSISIDVISPTENKSEAGESS